MLGVVYTAVGFCLLLVHILVELCRTLQRVDSKTFKDVLVVHYIYQLCLVGVVDCTHVESAIASLDFVTVAQENSKQTLGVLVEHQLQLPLDRSENSTNQTAKLNAFLLLIIHYMWSLLISNYKMAYRRAIYNNC